MKKIQETCFLFVGCLLGSFAPLYGKTFNYFLLFFILFHAITNWQTFVKDLQVGKKYILVFVIYFLYISLQTSFLTWGNKITDKPYYGIFEDLLLNFILIPIYVATMRSWLTQRLLKLFLFLFCAGCLIINLYIVYDTVKLTLFTDTYAAFEHLYATRFGDNKLSLLGGNLYLEPQTLFIALTALISYFMIFINHHKGMKILSGIMFLLLSMFLSFTVTKAGIIAFFVGFIIINIFIFRHSLLKVRLVMLICTLILLVTGVFMFDGLKGKYGERAEEIRQEVENVKHGIYTGGTIAPRVGFIRESFIHTNEFGLWGLGIYSKNRVNTWLQNSEAELGIFTNVHNTFIHYWIQGGILGLGMILFLFLAPFYQMIKNKKFSWLILSLVTIIFITNNTCILLALNNSRLMIILLLAMFYFYSDTFAQQEKTFINKSTSP